MLNLYVVRHGKTIFNEKHLIQGVCDSPLTSEGIAEADQLHDKLQNIHFEACYVSPLSRAEATASHILKGKDIPVYVNDNLSEFNFGSMEGDSEEKLRTIYPVLNGEHVKGFDGEEMPHFTDRIMTALNEIKEKNPDGNVLVVTHSGVITALLNMIGTVSKKDTLHIDNCSITHLIYANTWKIAEINA